MKIPCWYEVHRRTQKPIVALKVAVLRQDDGDHRREVQDPLAERTRRLEKPRDQGLKAGSHGHALRSTNRRFVKQRQIKSRERGGQIGEFLPCDAGGTNSLQLQVVDDGAHEGVVHPRHRALDPLRHEPQRL